MIYSQSELLALVEQAIVSNRWKREPEGLYAPIEYVLSLGGKRVRPSLVLMACNLFTDDLTEALKAGLAIEVFHNFTLLHDDIMDNADTRRGYATVHKRWNNNTAILSGDAMLIEAYKLLATVKSERFSEILKVFTTTADEVCKGQQYDMELRNKMSLFAENTHTRKGLSIVMVTSYGLKRNEWANGIQRQVTMDDLFVE
ncbi:MAG: polyprenyl synthetase family protein [Paludibacteraceae bacterium]|nr:polyprenyl synthetase family protein [Paludibacteraceae bacterium]